MANHLKRHKKLMVVNALVEGCSIRSTERMTGVHRDTIMRLGVRLGQGCKRLMDRMMRDLGCERLQIDEIWSFVGKKQKHLKDTDPDSVGDAWTFVAIDADTKLVPAWLVGKRDLRTAQAFMNDVASRLRRRVQISTDGLAMYIPAVSRAFDNNVDYAMVVKEYEAEPVAPGRYSPPRVTGIVKTPILGQPIAEDVSTSFVERQNLTMRMQIRRMTRLTNAFSKKLENHRAAIALHFAHYNLVRQHRTLRCSPAMAAGVTSTLWSLDELIDAAGSV